MTDTLTATADSLTDTRQVPREALCFDAPLEFAGRRTASSDPAETPVTINARSPVPIEHWYWGKIVHDFDGMVHDDAIPIDYCHNPRDVLGVIDGFDIDPERGLICTGQLVHLSADDRATEVRAKSQARVPYQASINFAGSPLRLEEVPDGYVATVNGRQVEGPAVIVREWPLRGVAVCPYGADQHTHSELSDRADQSTTIPVLVRKDLTMPKKTQPDTTKQVPRDGELSGDALPVVAAPAKQLAAPTPAAGETTPAARLDSETSSTAISPDQLKRFTERFGAENAAAWLAEGKTEAEAIELFCQQLQAELDQREAQITELTERLASLDRGEADPVDGRPADAKSKSFADCFSVRD